MAIAQMNWGRMRHPLEDPRMAEFAASLDEIYRAAEHHSGFIWRIPDDAAAVQLGALGFDEKTSATVSVWTDVAALRDYTFHAGHGEYLKRAKEWFDVVEGPQLVIWDVDPSQRPDFAEAFERLEYLKRNGASPRGYGWP